MDLAAECYRLSRSFPREELFAFTPQLRRAVVSVPSNIAEGNGRVHRKEYLHHLSITRGSLNETETLVELAVMLGYAEPHDVKTAIDLANEVGRLLTGLRRSLTG